MKVLEICSEPPANTSGIGRSVRFEVAGLRALGNEVSVLHPTVRLGEFKFSRIGLRRHRGHDIIHVHGPTPLLSDLTLLRNLGSPLVYTHYAEVRFISQALSSSYTRLHRLLASKAGGVVVWSDDYARLFQGRVAVIRPPIGLRPPRTSLNKRERFTVLYVGQLRPFKGVDVLLKAAAACPDIDFWIVGDGWYKPNLVRLAAHLANVTFLGPIYDDSRLGEAYGQAHVVVLPARNTTEAYGLAVIEGALFGCLPIASDLLGVRENIARLRGETFPTGDPTALAQIVSSFARDPGAWQDRSEHAREAAVRYAREHTVEEYAIRHLEFFERVLGTALA